MSSEPARPACIHCWRRGGVRRSSIHRDVVSAAAGRVAAGGGAVGAVGRELPAVGVHRRAPRRPDHERLDAIPDQELGEVGLHRRRAGREPVAPLRRGHRLGVLGVLALRPRPGRGPHVLSGAVARAARAPVPGLRSRRIDRRVRGAAALGGHDDVRHRPDPGHRAIVPAADQAAPPIVGATRRPTSAGREPRSSSADSPTCAAASAPGCLARRRRAASRR